MNGSVFDKSGVTILLFKSGTLNIKNISVHWDGILRLATSIKKGTVTAS